MALPINQPGLVQGGTDPREIDLVLYGQEILAALPELDYLPKLTMEKSIVGGKSARFPVMGRTTPFRFTYGWNLYDAANGGDKARKYANAFHEIEIDLEPMMAYTLIPEGDMLAHMDPDGIRREIAKDHAQQLAIAKQLHWMSVLWQASAHKTDLANTGDNVTFSKSGAAVKAGLTDGTDNDFGYHSLETTTPTGKQISDALFVAHDYAKFLRWPGPWYCILGTRWYTTLVQDIGLPVSAASPTVTPIPALNNTIMGSSPGSYSDVRITKHAGFTILDTPWLTSIDGTGLGTALETQLKVTAPTTADEKKYQPTEITAANMPLYKFQKTIQTKVQHAPGGAGTQPNTWTEFKQLMDKIGGFCFNPTALGFVNFFGVRTEGGNYEQQLQGTPLIAKYFSGGGILRGECALSLISSKVTTA
jgi:hypothetical protein